MEQDKTIIKVAILTFLISIFMFLEGSGVTNFGDGEESAPAAILILVGFIFMLTGIMILLRKNARLNNLLAALLMAGMGSVGAWVSLYGDASKFSANNTWMSYVTDLPLERMMFGFGALMCFLLSAYAFSLFLKNKVPGK